MPDVDTLVLGSGMAGLSVAALLARDGERVRILEAHDRPGGYAHTFPMGKQWNFCAQVHYIFSCGEGETIGQFLAALGLSSAIQFQRLDPEGFDHVVIAGDRYRVPNGLEKHRDRLTHRFPAEAKGLRGYFALLAAVNDELARVPDKLRWTDYLSAPLRFPHLFRERSRTLQDIYDRLQLSRRLQGVLAGQAGDYLLPPNQVSFLLHASLVGAYDRGASYPTKHFKHFVDSIAGAVSSRPGCELRLNSRVERIETQSGRVTGVRTNDGSLHTAKRYISNIDPKQTVALAGGAKHFPADFHRPLDYQYSSGTITLYLGTKGVDLRDHGFGSFNTWHYPHDDLNEIYARQASELNPSDPWLFMSTPTLHTPEPGLAPEGGQILCVATSCAAEPFHALRAADIRGYRKLKREITERILDVLEAKYVPRLREHLAIHLTGGTPPTNERYCLAPLGNAYGAELTPKGVGRRVPMETPLRNLWLCNATAGWPSVAGTIGSGVKLYRVLTGRNP